MLMLILMGMLFVGVIRVGLRLAWGTIKFVFGLGLFWFCPLLFILAVMFGCFGYLWLPIVIIGLVMGNGYRKSF